ncbi:uncharacterized protein PG986_001926, partial [Apiospora aurea]
SWVIGRKRIPRGNGMSKPTGDEIAATLSASPAMARVANVEEGSGDVEKREPADHTPGDNNDNSDSRTAVKTNTQRPNLTGLPFLLLLFSVFLSILQIALNATITSTVIPIITDEFHSAADVGWYASSYFVTTTDMITTPKMRHIPLTGKLFRLFNVKATFIAFLAIYFIGSLLAGLARSSAMFIGARAVAGVGGSGILTGSMTLIAMSVPLAKRSVINGILMGMFATFQAVGPVIGGALTAGASWRWCFYINLPLGGAVMVFIGLFVKIPIMGAPARPSTDDAAGPPTLYEKLIQIDLVGLLIFVLATALFLVGLQWGGTTYPWSSGMVVGFMVGGIAGFGVLAGWFWYKGDAALIPAKFFKMRVLNMISLTAVVQAGGTFTALYWYPIWFQAVKGASALQSGTMLLPLILSQLVFSVLSGGLVQKTGYYLPEVVAGNVFIALGSGLTTMFVPSTKAGEWIGYQILVGAGRGLALQVLVTAIQANVPNEDASIASAYVMFAQFFGGALFNCVAKAIMTTTLPSSLAKYAPDVDPRVFANTGITEVRNVISAAHLPAVLLAYNKVIMNVFYLQLAAACVALLTGLGVGWKNLNEVGKERAKEEGAAPTGMSSPSKE